MKTKYEQLIEFIINEEEDKARALFHEIVVEKSREIYESLIDEEDLEEAMGGDDVEEMVDEITDEEDEMQKWIWIWIQRNLTKSQPPKLILWALKMN